MTSKIQKDLSKMNKIPLSRVDGLSVAPLWSAYPEIRAMEKNSNNIFQLLHVILCFHCFSNLLTKIFTENCLNLLLCDGTKIPEFPIDTSQQSPSHGCILWKSLVLENLLEEIFFYQKILQGSFYTTNVWVYHLSKTPVLWNC